MPLILGAIVMWSGALIDIPEGWALCDGTNNTLDLRNRFVMGAGDLYEVGATGGSANATLVSHNHTVQCDTSANHTHTFTGLATGAFGQPSSFRVTPQTSTLNTSAEGNHSHTVSITATGTSAINANLPPYYALAFIQQIS